LETSPLLFRVEGREIIPRWLGPADVPWIRALLFEYERFVGRRRAELCERLQEPLPIACASWKLDLAVAVLDRLSMDRATASIPPDVARAEVFVEAAKGGAKDEVLGRVAKTHQIEPAALADALFADLPGERRVTAPEAPIAASELVLRINHALAQSLLRQATIVRVGLMGESRAVVRHAKLQGLLCTVTPRDGGYVLEVSGAISLFRRTTLYGRALGGLLGALAWCNRFVLHADCDLGLGPKRLVIRSGDPICPREEPRRFDSAVEARFARDFARLAPEWDVVREPEPVPADGTLIFPDFALVRRSRPEDRWLLEVVGFWTPQYLDRKLRHLRAAGLDRLVLCIDLDRNCSNADFPAGAHVIRYRRRIDAKEVLRAITKPSRGRVLS
jgi:hypothetical protein